MGWTRAICGATIVWALASRPATAQAPANGKEPDAVTVDRNILRSVGLTGDAPGLLEYFRKRTFAETDPKRVAALIKDLGNDEFTIREKAHGELLTLGPGALVGVKEAQKSAVIEISRRASELRNAIEAKAEPAVQEACARQIARVKPEGAAGVLIAYLPFADPSVVDEIGRALTAVGIKNGEAEPVLVKALHDRLPLKRGVAGQALVAAKDQRSAIRALLKDSDASVRLRVSMALVRDKDKDALTTMVDALADLPPEQLWPAEEILFRLAGDKAPNVSLGNTEAGRVACRDAWARWLRENKATINLAELERAPKQLGYTLVVQQQGGRFGRAGGTVMELDDNEGRKPRWQFAVSGYPVDAQVIGPDRVLVAEFHGRCISERDFKGEVKRRQEVPGNPLGIQRLANGNVFVIMQNRLMEFNRKGEEVFNFQGPFIFRARKAKNGEIVYISNVGEVVFLNPKTRQPAKSFALGDLGALLGHNLFGSIDILANGHILVPQFQAKQIVEYDREGKQVGEPLRLQEYPSSVVRLPNGNTLVGSMNSSQVAEYDRTGRQLWVHAPGAQVFNVRRR